MFKKILVLGYSDVYDEYKDVLFILSGDGKGDYKNGNVDWNEPGFFKEFVAHFKSHKFDLIFIDPGTESWLYRVDMQEFCSCIFRLLSKNGVFFAYFSQYTAAVFMATKISSTNATEASVNMNKCIVQNYVEKKHLNAWTLFIKKTPNGMFVINELYYIYSKQSNLSDTILKKYDNIMRKGIVDADQFIGFYENGAYYYVPYDIDSKYSDLKYEHMDIKKKYSYDYDSVLYIIHSILLESYPYRLPESAIFNFTNNTDYGTLGKDLAKCKTCYIIIHTEQSGSAFVDCLEKHFEEIKKACVAMVV